MASGAAPWSWRLANSPKQTQPATHACRWLPGSARLTVMRAKRPQAEVSRRRAHAAEGKAGSPIPMSPPICSLAASCPLFPNLDQIRLNKGEQIPPATADIFQATRGSSARRRPTDLPCWLLPLAVRSHWFMPQAQTPDAAPARPQPRAHPLLLLKRGNRSRRGPGEALRLALSSRERVCQAGPSVTLRRRLCRRQKAWRPDAPPSHAQWGATANSSLWFQAAGLKS